MELNGEAGKRWCLRRIGIEICLIQWIESVSIFWYRYLSKWMCGGVGMVAFLSG